MDINRESTRSTPAASELASRRMGSALNVSDRVLLRLQVAVTLLVTFAAVFALLVLFVVDKVTAVFWNPTGYTGAYLHWLQDLPGQVISWLSF